MKPESVRQHLCWQCGSANDHTIRSFKIACCGHFDVPEEKPYESEKPESEKEEVTEVEIVAEPPTEIFSPPEITSVEDNQPETAVDASSSDSDDSIRKYLNSKLQRIKKNRTRTNWSPVDKSRSYQFKYY